MWKTSELKKSVIFPFIPPRLLGAVLVVVVVAFPLLLLSSSLSFTPLILLLLSRSDLPLAELPWPPLELGCLLEDVFSFLGLVG
jgi:hypothetical protein